MQFEKMYSNAKAWTTKFFFLDGTGWEFPKVKRVVKDFPVREIWAPFLDDKSLAAKMAPLSLQELARVEAIRS